MEATRSSETSVYNKSTRSHIPEDGTLHGVLLFCFVQRNSAAADNGTIRSVTVGAAVKVARTEFRPDCSLS
jgi:hypothetical protein